jgi:hypothetical protein
MMGVAGTVGGKRLDPALKQRFLERLDAVGSVFCGRVQRQQQKLLRKCSAAPAHPCLPA